MKKSTAIFLILLSIVVPLAIGIKIGRNQAIKNARLVHDDGETYVIAYGYGEYPDNLDEEVHEYRRTK